MTDHSPTLFFAGACLSAHAASRDLQLSGEIYPARGVGGLKTEQRKGAR